MIDLQAGLDKRRTKRTKLEATCKSAAKCLWVDAREELPPLQTYVLLWGEQENKETMGAGLYTGSQWRTVPIFDRVTHWMPLPFKKIHPAENKKSPRSPAQYMHEGDGMVGRVCTLNDEAALWAARMCVGEGGKQCSRKKASAMLWALMNRFLLHPARNKWPTFLYLMRRFSQPINPRWQRGGDLAKKFAGKPASHPLRLSRRERICKMSWSAIPDQIIKAVTDFQYGELPPPGALKSMDKPRISNWASHKGLSKKYPWGVSFEGGSQPDWFFEDQRLRKGKVIVRA
jgi:hypothetical protein